MRNLPCPQVIWISPSSGFWLILHTLSTLSSCRLWALALPQGAQAHPELLLFLLRQLLSSNQSPQSVWGASPSETFLLMPGKHSSSERQFLKIQKNPESPSLKYRVLENQKKAHWEDNTLHYLFSQISLLCMSSLYLFMQMRKTFALILLCNNWFPVYKVESHLRLEVSKTCTQKDKD